jgi:Universal stress protein family
VSYSFFEGTCYRDFADASKKSEQLQFALEEVPMKVLLGIDGSRSSEAALQALVAMVRPQEVEVRILHVVEMWPIHVPSSK